MKSLIVIFLLSTPLLTAATPTENLNPKLVKLFNQIQSNDAEIKGKSFECTLTLKVGNERFLIFSDAYISIEKNKTKYQIAKWIFTPEQTVGLKDKRGSKFKVKFKVKEVKTEAPYSNMPHIVANIISIEALTPNRSNKTTTPIHE